LQSGCVAKAPPSTAVARSKAATRRREGWPVDAFSIHESPNARIGTRGAVLSGRTAYRSSRQPGSLPTTEAPSSRTSAGSGTKGKHSVVWQSRRGPASGGGLACSNEGAHSSAAYGSDTRLGDGVA